jgi:hypothetical protein
MLSPKNPATWSAAGATRREEEGSPEESNKVRWFTNHVAARATRNPATKDRDDERGNDGSMVDAFDYVLVVGPVTAVAASPPVVELDLFFGLLEKLTEGNSLPPRSLIVSV